MEKMDVALILSLITIIGNLIFLVKEGLNKR